MTRPPIQSLAKLLLLIALLGAAYYGAFHTQVGRSVHEAIEAYLKEIHPAWARVLYVLFYVVGTVLLMPGLLLSFVGALLFGVWEGTLYTWIGATLGAVLAFGLARRLGRDFIDQMLGGKLRQLDDRLRERGFISLLIIRLVPLFPFNGVNFGCGLTSLRTRDYVLATAIGIVPGTFVYQYLFATFGRRALESGFEWSELASAEFLAPLGVFAGFVVVTGWLAGKLRKQTPREDQPTGAPPALP